MTRPIIETDTDVFNHMLIPNTPVGPLLAGQTYTGEWLEVYQWNTLVFSMKTDVDGTLYAEFSTDGVNVDSSLSYDVTGGSGEGPHRLTIGRHYFRMRYENNGTDQSYWRFQCIAGSHPPITSVLGRSMTLDSDSLIVRQIPPEFEISRNTIVGVSKNNKIGRNGNVSNAASYQAPQFITEQGGFYTGFPINVLEKVRIVSTDVNDTSAGSGAREVRVIGIDADWNILSEDIPLNGTTAVESANNFRRIHTMFVIESGSSTVANIGTITVNHFPTTANVFATILPYVGSSNYAVYTVPENFVGIIRDIKVEIKRSQSAQIEGSLWVRQDGASPRFQRPFSASNDSPHFDDPYGGLSFPAKTDIALVVNSSSANSISVIGKFDIVLFSTVL